MDLPLESFQKRSTSKDGLNGRCKSCKKEYEHYWHAKNCVSVRARVRLWKINNPERQQNKKRERYQRNRQIMCEQRRSWRSNNPFRMWSDNTLDSHRRKGFKINVSRPELEDVARGAVKCVYCNVDLDWRPGKGKMKSNSPTLDRIYNGKIIDLNSIQVICNRCNIVKGNEFGDALRNRLTGMLRHIL